MSLTEDFFANPLAFANRYSIAPDHEIEGDKGVQAATIDMSDYNARKAIGPANSDPELNSIIYSRMMRAHKVAHVELYADMRNPHTPTDATGGNSNKNNEGTGVVRVRGKFSAFGDALPAYFLPWDDRGAIVRLTIPPKGKIKVDPNIFFTATINGCSVFVQGDTKSPTIYHAGGSTGRKDHNDAARFWRHALQNYIGNSESANARGKLVSEVNKTQYIKTPGTQNNSTTPQAAEYERILHEKLEKTGSCEVTMVNPWGCIFGIRSGDSWTMYLQENATVICNYLTKAQDGKVSRRTVPYAKPIGLSQIFPGGTSSIAKMHHMVPVTIK